MLPLNFETEREKSIDPSWSTDELLTLFRIRSNMENWFPDFTWDDISRKLAEFGFQKSGEMCKDKFEEETRYLNNMSNISNFPNNYRVFAEFEDPYHSENNNNQNPNPNPHKKLDKGKGRQEEEEEEEDKIEQEQMDPIPKEENGKLKRKRDKSYDGSSFEMMFKGFCEDIISTIIAQQEQMHNKLLEDMAKRDQEKIAREEEWKKQEFDRIDKELQLRTQDHVLASDRQASIINFLNKFSTSSTSSQNPNPPKSSSTIIEDKDSTFLTPKSNPIKPTLISISKDHHQNPNSSSSSSSPGNPNLIRISTSNERGDDLGKRWPKDEVLALINLRCSYYNEEEIIKESTKGPLWERISKGMLELGYTRSSKRCKEKWENINKYFRKTKDVNKKRCSDSRTCPYFHQLSTLYTQGKLVPTHQSTNSTLFHVDHQDDKISVQPSGFEFP